MASLNPIIDRQRPHYRWNINEVYNGTPERGAWVPNPDDEVWSWADGLYRVVSVNYQTGLSVLEKHSDKNLSSGLREDDVILSSKPGAPADTFRIYVNTTVVPHVMNFDNFLHVYGTNAHYLKIFKGTDIGINGDVISAQFNSSGILITENILFEQVRYPEGTIRGIKTPESGFVTDTLTEGEIVTVVVYGGSGEVLSVSKLVTVLSNTVRNIDASKKQITNISLISPFLSNTDNLLLEVPINLTVESMPMQMAVTYNDGSKTTYAIGDDKASLLGIENFISSEMGYTADLVLTYTLGKGEYSNLVKTAGERNFINKPYRLRTIDSDSAYSVKLFVVPKWNYTKNEWELDFFMYTLDRDIMYRVTPYIEYNVNSPTFKGKVFSVPQQLQVSVNLSKVHNSYNYYRHSMSFKITLNQPATNLGSAGYYLLEYNNDSIVGARAVAVVNEFANVYTMDISQGLMTGGDILDSLYWNTEPLYYEYAEAAAPAPTHARIKVGSTWSRTLPVDELPDVLQNVDAPADDVRQGSLVRIEWYRQTQTGILELGTVALTVRR